VLGRPETERPGTFKKASNLNFTLRLVDAGAAPERGSMSHEAAIEAALALRLGDDHRRSAYARGELVVGEVALLLDKDSTVPAGVSATPLPTSLAIQRSPTSKWRPHRST
jgi:hypothetical protein